MQDPSGSRWLEFISKFRSSGITHQDWCATLHQGIMRKRAVPFGRDAVAEGIWGNIKLGFLLLKVRDLCGSICRRLTATMDFQNEEFSFVHTKGLSSRGLLKSNLSKGISPSGQIDWCARPSVPKGAHVKCKSLAGLGMETIQNPANRSQATWCLGTAFRNCHPPLPRPSLRLKLLLHGKYR